MRPASGWDRAVVLVALIGLGLASASAQEPPPPAAPAPLPTEAPVDQEVPPVTDEEEPDDAGLFLPLLDPQGDTAEFLGPLDDLRDQGALKMRVGLGRLLTYPGEVARVAIADEKLARVQLISTREMLVTGLQPGLTRLFVWLADGSRLRYRVEVEWDLDLLGEALAELDPRITAQVSPNGRSIVLRGEVEEKTVARLARARAESLVQGIGQGAGGPRVIDWLRYPGAVFSVEEELAALLEEIDPRISVRRIQVGEDPNIATDTFVLEGRVPDVNTLVRAIIMSERQLGGTGTRISAGFEDDRVAQRRSRGGFGGGFSGVGGGAGGGLAGGVGRGGADPRSSSLASQVARGLLLTSASGRVVSTLRVDRLAQVMVSARVLEVDRIKTRRAGVNFQIQGDKVSIGSFTVPGLGRGSIEAPSLTQQGGANLVAAFVDQTTAILAAFDFLQENNLARAVAEPNVLTLSGELANIVVGGEVPIPTTTANQAATFQGFFYQDFGVRLDIRPTVTEDDVVLLEVAPSIIRPSAGTNQGVPGFTIQSVTTTARVPAGESLLLGGLLSFDEGLVETRVPGLGWLPFFRSKRRSRSERELLFLITPRLVEFDPRRVAEDPVVDPRPRRDEIELPELSDPRFISSWKDPNEAPRLPIDGIPETFRTAAASAPDAAGGPRAEDADGEGDSGGGGERIDADEPGGPESEPLTQSDSHSTTGAADDPDLDLVRQVEATVESWRRAWESQRVEEYLDHYAGGDSPRPGFADRQAWEAERRRQISAPGLIRLCLDRAEIVPESSTRARASFCQSYRNEHYRDQGTKTLELIRPDGTWRIVGERFEPLPPGARCVCDPGGDGG